MMLFDQVAGIELIGLLFIKAFHLSTLCMVISPNHQRQKNMAAVSAQDSTDPAGPG